MWLKKHIGKSVNSILKFLNRKLIKKMYNKAVYNKKD